MRKKPTRASKQIKVEQRSRNVLFVHHDDVVVGWEKWYLLTSDRHHDNAHCDRELELEHLRHAQDRDAHVVDVGDVFDAMQGRYDPRRSYPDMRPEYATALKKGDLGYFDLIVGDATEFYAPFADRFLVIGKGNHETSVSKHNDTDLTQRLVGSLNQRAKTKIAVGEYGGWLSFLFKRNGSTKQRINLKYFHGAGGGQAQVTRGVIQSNRQAVFLPDADIVVNGHIHESWVVPIARERLSEKGVVSTSMQYHVRTATYKDDYGDGARGWHVESGKPPKPKGAVWMKFSAIADEIKVQLIQDVR